MKKPLPIGHDDFKKLRENELYYVDKTLLIKELLSSKSEVTLITRPRRFGKSLALSMLRHFFEKEWDSQGKEIDKRSLFEGLAIMDSGKQYTCQLGQYPVIKLTLRSSKQPNFDMAYKSLVNDLAGEYLRHRFILDSDCLSAPEKEKYWRILSQKGELAENARAIEFLSSCLEKYYEKKVIILIDEYDVPLENAYFQGFYNQMIDFIRSLFESALKTNESLQLAVITGCLRISRESIFTGLNNLDAISILSDSYAEHFGFTQEEVERMLQYYGMTEKVEEAAHWYDGYLFGSTEVYNPWSIINYVKAASRNPKAFPKPYWSNTSSNSIVQELVEKANFETRDEIERLVTGETIEKPVHEDITYGDIYESPDNLWNFLYFTGYLKKTDENQMNETIYLKLAIPNAEVRSIYRNTILAWFDKKIKKTDLTPLFTAIDEGDCEAFGLFVSKQLLDTISFFDYAESYYHGFLAGLLKNSQKYLVYSNRESGTGRPDILMKSPSVRMGAVILGLKSVDSFHKMEDACKDALKQIKEQNYEAGLQAEGYRKIKKYGVCFYKKECLVLGDQIGPTCKKGAVALTDI